MEDQWEARLRQIMSMPEGPDKQAALQDLFMDYPGRAEQLESDRNTGLAMATQRGAKGTNPVPGNPFSVYTAASPIEHAVRGAQAYMGGKQYKESRDELKKLSGAQQRARTQFAMSPFQQKAQAAQLRQPPDAMNLGGTGFLQDPSGLPPGASEEDRERYRRMLLGL